MPTRFLKLLWLVMSAICSSAAEAQLVVYDTTNGGLYNGVGPIFASPEYEGDRFTVPVSGYLYSIALPLVNDFPSNGPFANGTITLWSDAGNSVGTPLFSASVSATNFPWTNTQLPPFTILSATVGSPPFLLAGTNYWLTLSQTAGSGGLVGFSNVHETSAQSVYFENGEIQYANGLQPFVLKISILAPPPQLTIVRAVTVDCQKLVVGSNYQFQASSDLITWTNWGSAFTATNSSLTNSSYLRVGNWNQLFFRLQSAP